MCRQFIKKVLFTKNTLKYQQVTLSLCFDTWIIKIFSFDKIFMNYKKIVRGTFLGGHMYPSGNVPWGRDWCPPGNIRWGSQVSSTERSLWIILDCGMWYLYATSGLKRNVPESSLGPIIVITGTVSVLSEHPPLLFKSCLLKSLAELLLNVGPN